MEVLQEINPEAAKEELLKIEQARAVVCCVWRSYVMLSRHISQDRMSLRHKNTSKWAKQMIRNNPDDENIKFACRKSHIISS